MTFKVKGQGHAESQGHTLVIAFNSISLALYLHQIMHEWILKNLDSNGDMSFNVKGQAYTESESQMPIIMYTFTSWAIFNFIEARLVDACVDIF